MKAGQKQKMGDMDEMKEYVPENPHSMADHLLLKYKGTQVIHESHNSGTLSLGLLIQSGR